MHPAPLARLIVFPAALALLLAAGCGPGQSPVSVRVKHQVGGPDDLVKGATPDPRWHAFQLHTFQMNHVWASAGRTGANGEVYRAKITIWSFDQNDAPIAELYFHDLGHDVSNPDFKDAPRPYQLHFPMSSIGPILQALRNANEPVYLYYFENQWAIGIAAPEPIGID